MIINKIRADHVIDFAAEELKKYLRMMMPESPEIDIVYNPDAKNGFRLGLLSDFSLDTSEASDLRLDDIVHIDTDNNGGIIAGSNMRSVLFAVYRFLYENGCRWLYPGIDGEHIPVREIGPVYYHKMADNRFRGFCNEGGESQQCMIETIDFYPKLGLNVYMLEFDIPYFYYDRYYSHKGNDTIRKPEPVSKMQVKQWKRQCEAEISKRGLQFHDMGHGWTCDSFGFDSAEGWDAKDVKVPEDKRKYLAQIDGKREFFKGVPILTNLCMSNPETRSIMANYIADYAESHKNVDYLHVWLADDHNNHCECDECVKMRPTDYYMMLMNDIDKILTDRKLETRIVFISYNETLWGPEKVVINNTERFSLLFARSTRGGCSSINDKTSLRKELPFIRNAIVVPENAEQNLGLIQSWKKMWKGPCFSYEYHFWKEFFFEPAGTFGSKKIYNDLHGLEEIGIDGYVQDGTQRAFFPNGLSVYTFAFCLFDRALSYEQILEDYMNHAYGGDWKKVYNYLEKISDAFDFEYMNGEKSEDISRHKYYAPSRYERLKNISELTKQISDLECPECPTRAQRISYRLLELHAIYCAGLSDILAEKCVGNDSVAWHKYLDFCESFGKHEYEIERYYDQGLMWQSFRSALFVSDDKSFIEGI